MGKCQNPGGALASKAHAPETIYDKKAEEDKNIFINKQQ